MVGNSPEACNSLLYMCVHVCAFSKDINTLYVVCMVFRRLYSNSSGA